MLAFAAAAANMEDDSEALESVLAFIEAYNVDALSTDEGSAIDAEAAPPPAKAKAKAKAKAPRRKRAKRDSDSTEDEKPSASTTSYTTMLQRRKRAEVQTLREEVQELEMHLTRLQRARWGDDSTENPPTSAQKSSPSKRKRSSSEPPSTIRLSEMWDELAKNAARENGVPIDAKSGSADSLVKQKGDNEWLDAAVAEYRLRRRSELKNRQLKALMRQQSNLNTSVLRLLQKRAPFPGVEALLVSSTSNTFPSEIVEYRIQEAAVESEIMQLYREVELVLGPPPGDGIESIVCSLEGKHSPSIGRHIEVRTTTPMTRSASKAAMRVWRKLCSNPDQHLNFFSETSGPDSYVKKFFLPVTCRDRHPDSDVLLNVRHHARKFDETNRYVTIMYATIQPPVPGMFLREDSWTVITPSKTSPKHACVMQTCYRIYAERADKNIPPSDEAVEMCSFVMTALGRLTRRNMQTTQNWLLDETASPFPDWILT